MGYIDMGYIDMGYIDMGYMSIICIHGLDIYMGYMQKVGRKRMWLLVKLCITTYHDLPY